MTNTISMDIKATLDWANFQLGRTDAFATYEFKAGICMLLEHILLTNNCYNGFMFLNTLETRITDKDYYSRKYSLVLNKQKRRGLTKI
jgi:hypothetical protein